MLKSHTLVPDHDYQHIRYELRPGRRPDGPARGRAVQRLDHSRQPRPAQQLHDRRRQGGHPRVPPGEHGPPRRRVRVHRDGRQGVLHRRQHQGVRRVLRGQSAGVQAVHAAVQRHDRRHPALRQAGDQPRQRHAHRRRPGDRHGLRLHHRGRHGDVRPGRPAARLGARRRLDRLPAAVRRLLRGGRERRAVRAVERAPGAAPGPDQPGRAGAAPRRRVDPQPDGRARSLVGRVRQPRVRPVQGGRRARRREGDPGPRDDRPDRASTPRSRTCARACSCSCPSASPRR